MTHPYSNLPDSAFWRRAVVEVEPTLLDPVTETPFKISQEDRVATAGSCFAKRLSAAIMREGFNYFVAEDGPKTSAAVDENFGVYSARYGNIYTAPQLIQLFERAYGQFVPRDDVWVRPDGRFVDPFRPRVQTAGFPSPAAVREDREAHLATVRDMFEHCDVFVFTLGLTECWASVVDGAVVPLPPGVVGGPVDGQEYRFENLSVARMTADFLTFVDKLRMVNPEVRIVITVSPVSIVATYEPRHVVVSNGYTKSALRVVAEIVSKERERISYFPGYEIAIGPGSGGRFLTPDRRGITEDGVAHVSSIFSRHYFTTEVTGTESRARHSMADAREVGEHRPGDAGSAGIGAWPRFRQATKIATIGGGFARVLGGELRRRNLAHLVLENCPDFVTDDVARAHGYRHFSVRSGEVRTPRQFLQLLQRARGVFSPEETSWRSGERWIDPYRPAISPRGFESEDSLRRSVERHLSCVRAMVEQADVLVFTPGQSGAWSSARDGAVFPERPDRGEEPGDSGQVVFRNFTFNEILADLTQIAGLIRELNPGLKLILTVSSDEATDLAGHKGSGNQARHSKTMLRAAAGELAATFREVNYFPAYELVLESGAGAEELARGEPAFEGRATREFFQHYFGQTFIAREAEAPVTPRASRGPASAMALACDEQFLDFLARAG